MLDIKFIKMKGRIFIYFICLAVGFSSCEKEDSPAFEESADERINKALTTYQDKLVGADNGWKAFIYPKGGGTFFFYFKFNAQNRVKMYSTFDSVSAVTPMESSYRLKALQQPSLIFDTYSYVHALADPNENIIVNAKINSGPVGVGLQSDFEFYFDSTYTDSITLVGRFNGSKAVLVRATKQEADSYDNKELARGFLFQNLDKYLNYFKRVTIGGVAYEINVNQDTRTVTFSWLDGSTVRSFTTPFYYSSTGVTFVNSLVNGSQTISGLSNLTWNAATTTLGFTVNGTATTVVGLGQPLRVDVDAPKRWWQFAVDNGGTYWISFEGIHKDGIDDYFNFATTVPRYQYMHFWPKYNVAGTVTYDVFGVVYVNAAGTQLVQYATAPVPTFTTDGRITFGYLGSLGTSPNAATTTKMTAATNSVRSIITQPNGFYLIQTGPESYDMVSALDGKTWISWIF
jgi:hypothetical protein